jgi:NAD-dependent SIR2 family protein deacetylase
MSGADLARFLRGHPRSLVLTGAGCSTASGIPDYRDANGDWKHRRPVDYGDYVARADVRRRYWARSMAAWERFAAARPNRIHHRLARLETLGLCRQLVTQNVDGLHIAAGSRRVIELHGALRRVSCLDCGAALTRSAVQHMLVARNGEAPAPLGGRPDGDSEIDPERLAAFREPACPDCGGVLKPDVVFFGESVPPARVQRVADSLRRADALLCIGTSLMVWSGFRFCRAAHDLGLPIAIVNLGRTRADDFANLRLQGEAGVVLAQAVRLLEDEGNLRVGSAASTEFPPPARVERTQVADAGRNRRAVAANEGGAEQSHP